MKINLKAWLGAVFAVCLCGASVNALTVSAEETFATVTATEIVEINNESGLENYADAFIMVLSETDYMTAKEWSQSNYKWLNDEEKPNRATIDYDNNNVCNAVLDQNLSAYNFEEYILIDGEKLSTFDEGKPYKLIASKRTRVNTLSIDFPLNALADVETIEIQAGCQLPTLAYSYRGLEETSCLEVQKTVKFMRAEGKWVTYFGGYEEGAKYACDENAVQLNLAESFKGHEAVPLNAFTDFFTTNAIQNEYLDHKVLVSAANTEKGNLMVLNFVHPIPTAQFNQLDLRVYINHQIDLLTYNVNNITEGDLGTALETFTVGGGLYVELSLNSALYADADGNVSSIVFQFVNDCTPQKNAQDEELYDGKGRLIRDTFHFVSFRLKNVEKQLVEDESFILIEQDDAYEISFRFNKIGGIEEDVSLDTEKVTLNGCTLASVLAECADATAEWYSAQGTYQINVKLPKSYTGAAQIKNTEYGFAGNNMGVTAGLVFPNGDVLDKTYTCHLYAGEKFVDCEMVTQFRDIEVTDVDFEFVEGSENIHFILYFNKNVTSAPYYHACENEEWRLREIGDPLKGLYDAGTTQIFMDGGYKSSLLDSVVINGKTLGEWHAHDSRMPTNVQVHYGNTALNCVDVFFEAVSPHTYEQLYDLVAGGNGVTVEIRSGFKFMTNTKTAKDQIFVLEKGDFTEKFADTPLHVYFDGIEVTNGESLTLYAATSEKSLVVAGVQEYEITSAKNGNTVTYTVTYGDGEEFTFTVTEDIVSAPKVEEPAVGGCFSQMGVGSALSMLTALGLAAVCVMRRRENYEEKRN